MGLTTDLWVCVVSVVTTKPTGDRRTSPSKELKRREKEDGGEKEKTRRRTGCGEGW